MNFIKNFLFLLPFFIIQTTGSKSNQNPKDLMMYSEVDGPLQASITSPTLVLDSSFLVEPCETFNHNKYKIGDFIQGGIVFWLDETAEHGLVCSIFDQSVGISWDAGFPGPIGANERGVYSGKINTSIIISSQMTNGDSEKYYAALLCQDLAIEQNGIIYDDWYLPGLTELTLMFNEYALIDLISFQNGGTNLSQDRFYWSSNEVPESPRSAYANGMANFAALWIKDDNLPVRAIRAF